MGGSSWSTDVYSNRATTRRITGTSAFAYSDTVRASGKLETHESLDPSKAIAGDDSPLAGQLVREARDSDDHPNSIPVAVLFDVTGSMGGVPVGLQTKLPKLMELLQFKGYVSDAQILFGAIGDATGDKCPLQVGQFEADNRVEDHLGNIVLEGNGQGGGHESYELGLYFMARHTASDHWDKRGGKGYLFLIGDERPYPAVKAREVLAVIGADLGGENITIENIIREVRERWNVYFVMPGDGTSYGTTYLDVWRGLLGESVIVLDDLDAVAEVIAVTVGVAEETVTLEQAAADLAAHGTDDTTVDVVRSALTV